MRPWMFGFVIAAAAIVLAACAKEGSRNRDAAPSDSPSAKTDSDSLPDRDPALAHRLVEQEGALLLDVRSKLEYSMGHIDGARHVPHGEVAERTDEIASMVDGDKDAPIVVYCRSGRRSGIAKKALVEHGFTRVTNLGGMKDW